IVRIKAVDGGFFVNAPDNTKGILISANHSNGDEMEIYLSTRHIGTHKLDSNTYALSYGMHPKSYLLYRTIIGDQLITSFKYTGELIITKADTASGIISGTFNCSLGSPSGEVITISEGRFDINSKTINL
ncbi:MAG TPA: DUF6252 family protein, partial [Dyadobacter sp.]|nr:DUF6252 family protein [Dyadobacter sp.]